jgi:hypothetical protein
LKNKQIWKRREMNKTHSINNAWFIKYINASLIIRQNRKRDDNDALCEENCFSEIPAFILFRNFFLSIGQSFYLRNAHIFVNFFHSFLWFSNFFLFIFEQLSALKQLLQKYQNLLQNVKLELHFVMSHSLAAYIFSDEGVESIALEFLSFPFLLFLHCQVQARTLATIVFWISFNKCKDFVIYTVGLLKFCMQRIFQLKNKFKMRNKLKFSEILRHSDYLLH